MTRDELLDELFDRLTGTGSGGRRALSEFEDHLDDAVADGLDRGLTPEAAERAAVARFGSPEVIAGDLRLAQQGIGAVLPPLAVGAWVAGIFVLLAMGISGLVSELLGRIGSPELVAGDRNGVTYSAARCAEYLALDPSAKSCAEAAAFDHWGEVVLARVGAGVLGLLALGAFLLARRRMLRGAQWQPPALALATVLTALFALAGLVLAGPELVNSIAFSTEGTGAGLADGAVSLLFCAAIGAWLLRHAGRPSAARRTGSGGSPS